ncbi:protein-glucosylgalactosylhydroxylysine glucosidase-like [Saccostrea echinata]|uniref:protein-glucosylgalactosylhydroxylysine glucosidase-like n=1 Tax=Saccostrea echinata TaxID=191078 RepID=UPI002A83FB5C|nr:protein-glucosylgalactosylhydroxylysine glucosidase-like [Saccostrea echinata]
MLLAAAITFVKTLLCKVIFFGIRDEFTGCSPGDMVVLSHGGKSISLKSVSTITSPYMIPDITTLSTESLPLDDRLMPSIGNGQVAIVVKGEGVFMNGLYNGHNITSHRAKMPAAFIKDIGIKSNSHPKFNYSLDLAAATYIEEYKTMRFFIQMKMFAHRAVKQLLVTMVTVQNTGQATLSLGLNTTKIADTEDLEVTSTTNHSIGIISGRTKESEYDITGLQNVTMIHTIIPEEITVEPFEQITHLYLLSIDSDPEIAKNSFNKGVEMFFNQTLESSHVNAWANVWKTGRVDITGNKTLATLAYSSLYYILSSLPLKDSRDFVGLSPGDLAHGSGNKDYMGHVFWDQETWMYPSILLLHSQIGKVIVKTRNKTLGAAKETAKMRGYDGAMYPWETALSGLDVTADPIYFLNEQHITGDISFAIRQYLYLTHDIYFLNQESGQALINEIAKFWASRVSLNSSTNMYEIHDVMPPDEWHQQVNNSAFTNAVAKLSLLLPEFVCNLTNTKPDPRFKAIADRLYIPYDRKIDYHPEFDGYTTNMQVKQADVILLGFPFMLNMTHSTRKKDLRIYEAVTPGGPALTWSMFAVGNLEIGDTERASNHFTRQLLNVAKPFNVWTENADGTGAVNFITGMGGFLQSLLFGYGGIRLHPDRIDFHGRLPPSTTSFNITGLDYLGGSIDFYFSEEMTSVRLIHSARYVLKLRTKFKNLVLIVGKSQTFPNTAASIVPDLKNKRNR